MAPVKKAINSIFPELILVFAVLCSVIYCILLSLQVMMQQYRNDQCCIVRRLAMFILDLHHSGHSKKSLTVGSTCSKREEKEDQNK